MKLFGLVINNKIKVVIYIFLEINLIKPYQQVNASFFWLYLFVTHKKKDTTKKSYNRTQSKAQYNYLFKIKTQARNKICEL